MSLISFFFQNKPRGKIGTVVIDATVNDDVSYSSTITQNPVEDGSFVSDNITIMPFTVGINGLITDSPLFLPNNAENNVFLELDNSRVKNAYEQLLDLFLKKELFTVVTGLDIYTNVFFMSFDINRNADTGRALSFNAKFQEIRFVTPATIKIPRDTIHNGKKDLAQSNVNHGSGQTTSAKDKRPFASFLYEGFGSALERATGVSL